MVKRTRHSDANDNGNATDSHSQGGEGGGPEKETMASINKVLSTHPHIAFPRRMNSGVASMGGRKVSFNKIFGSHKKKFLSVDYDGMLVGGRFFFFEAKPLGWVFRPTGKSKGAEIARKQWVTIEFVNKMGGLAAFITSGEQLQKILDEAQREFLLGF